MADQNLDPELVERINRELALYGQLTARTAQDLHAARTAIADFNAKVSAAGGAVSALTGAFVTYNKEIYNGASANQAAAASMDKLAEAAKFAGVFLGLLVPGGPVVKAVVAGLGLLAASAIEASKTIAEYTHDVTKAYQDMARAGAAGAGGMKDVESALHNLGINVKRADVTLRLLSDNSQDLSLFGSTVLQGRKIFEKTMASLTAEQRVNMEMMGLDRDAQAEATLGYIKQQRMLVAGTREQMNTSSAAVMRYVQETDLLTRVTGLNRKEQEKLVEEAMRNEAYQATLAQIREEQGEAAAKQVQNALIMARKAGPETAKQFMDSLSGFVGSSDEAGKAFMATGGEIQEFTHNLRTGQITDMRQTAMAMNKVFQAYGETARQFRGQAQMMNYGRTFGSFYEAVNAGKISIDDLGKAVDAAETAEQKAQLQDALTRKAMENENRVRETAILQQKTLSFAMGAYIDSQVLVTSNNLKLAQAAFDAAKALADLSGKPVEGAPAVAKLTAAEARAAHEIATEAAAAAADRVRELNADVKATPEQRRAAEAEAERLMLESNKTARTLQQTFLEEKNARRKAIAEENAKKLVFPPPPAPAKSVQPTTISPEVQKARDETDIATLERQRSEERLQDLQKQRETLSAELEAAEKLLKEAKVKKDEEAVRSLQNQITELGKKRQQSRIDEFNARREAEQARQAELTARARLARLQAVQPPQPPATPAVAPPAAPAVQPPQPPAAPAAPAAAPPAAPAAAPPAAAPAPKSSLSLVPKQRPELGLRAPGTETVPGLGLQYHSQQDLEKMGLKIKTGDVQATDQGISPKLIELARSIQQNIPTFSYFSAFNDRFHQEKAPTSKHTKGLALDFAVVPKPSNEDGRAITDWLKTAGASLAIDEYNNPGAMTTAGHIHAEIPAFEEGGTLGAGRIGIAGEGGKPELITGPADITPMNDLMRAFGNMTSLLEISVGKLDAIARATAATSDSSARMLNYAQN